MIPVAVVGIDCRFPGSPDKDAYWRLLMDGIVTDSEVPAQRWNIDSYYAAEGGPGSMNSRRGHFIENADAFDNEFFGIAPIEAAALDPQQRMLLESSWRAFEDAGIDPRSLAGTPTGVFVGVMSSEWSNLQILDLPGITPFRGTGSGYFMTANRISYHLGLTGPSVAIDSACSSSLTAIHHACNALRSGEADTVLAAGTNLIVTPALSIFYTQAGLSAPDGRCKPFVQGADGIGRGEGVGTVVLRRLDDALAQGQPIYAVVKSTVTNHDGRSNGITAPSRRSQVALMRRALELAETDAEQIAFVEAHGTGTVLGDRIEANALGDLHRTRRGRPCLLGSVKGNIGHTEGSAGIAAFIKACLALHHRILPATVSGDRPDPRLRLEENGLRIADGPCELPDAGTLGAVSSFGLGGSNAHAVLQAAPTPALHASGEFGVLSISAPTTQALRRTSVSMADALESVDPEYIASWCRSTNVVKRTQRHRLVLEGNRATLLNSLHAFAAGAHSGLASSAAQKKTPANVGLLFSGQGTQHPGMTRRIYEANAVYRRNLDTVAAAIEPHLKTDLRAAIWGHEPRLQHTSLAQPALFAVSYALGKTLLQSGIHASFGIGHSLGEITAACLAGVLTVEAAAKLVVIRGQLMGSLPPGGAMIAVDLDLQQAERLITDEPDCAIAAINGPRALTISGPAWAVGRARAAIAACGGNAVDLRVSHAFHSPLMDPIVAEFQHKLEGLEPQPAEFRLFSTVLGREVAGEEMHAEYWARQISAPVRFFDAVQAAHRSTTPDYLAEAGPRTSLLALARQGDIGSDARALALCAGPKSDGTEMLAVAAILMRDGYSPDLSILYGGSEERSLYRIPPYTFDTSARFWSSGPASRHVRPVPTMTEPVHLPDPEEESVGRVHSERFQGSSEDAILALIADVGGYSVSAVSRSMRLTDDLGYDSLLQLRLLDRLRREHPHLRNASAEELLPKIHTVGDLIDFAVEQLTRNEMSA